MVKYPLSLRIGKVIYVILIKKDFIIKLFDLKLFDKYLLFC